MTNEKVVSVDKKALGHGVNIFVACSSQSFLSILMPRQLYLSKLSTHLPLIEIGSIGSLFNLYYKIMSLVFNIQQDVDYMGNNCFMHLNENFQLAKIVLKLSNKVPDFLCRNVLLASIVLRAVYMAGSALPATAMATQTSVTQILVFAM